MPKLKILSATQAIYIFKQFGFFPITQKGSHIKLRRMNALGDNEILVVPNHVQLRRGMIYKLFKDGCRHIPEEELRPHFYTS